MILCNDPEIGKKINSAVFPGLQGGPLMHVIAAKAAAFGEALRPEFRAYPRAVVDNAKVLAATLGRARPRHRLRRHRLPPDAGRSAAQARHRQGRRSQPRARPHHRNKNGIPFDPEKPTITSGVRLGSPGRPPRAASARPSSAQVGELIAEVLDGLARSNGGANAAVEAGGAAKRVALCALSDLSAGSG